MTDSPQRQGRFTARRSVRGGPPELPIVGQAIRLRTDVYEPMRTLMAFAALAIVAMLTLAGGPDYEALTLSDCEHGDGWLQCIDDNFGLNDSTTCAEGYDLVPMPNGLGNTCERSSTPPAASAPTPTPEPETTRKPRSTPQPSTTTTYSYTPSGCVNIIGGANGTTRLCVPEEDLDYYLMRRGYRLYTEEGQ